MAIAAGELHHPMSPAPTRTAVSSRGGDGSGGDGSDGVGPVEGASPHAVMNKMERTHPVIGRPIILALFSQQLLASVWRPEWAATRRICDRRILPAGGAEDRLINEI